jgi:tetratricopeptide (TPR) repeat protein
MANVSAHLYYHLYTAKEITYAEYMGQINDSLSSEIADSANRQIAANALFTKEIQSTLINNQIATERALYNHTQQLDNTLKAGFADVSNQLQSGFSDVSRQVGVMSANMSMAFAALNRAVQESAQALCDRLDTMNNILSNPSLTKTRELYRRAVVNYDKGFYEEAKNDLIEALASNKTDYISWFLLGKTYLFGASEFSNVIDLDAAVDALKNTVKFITPDARKQEDARALAAEMCFYLGLAQQNRAIDALRARNEAEGRGYLEQAGTSYGQSWDYSDKMLEARYNRARCKALLGDAPGAIADLEALVLADRNYCVKVCADYDFAGIKEPFAALIKKLKNAAFIPAQKDCERLKTLLAELAALGGTTAVTAPASFTEELPYFDVLDYAGDFKRNIPIVEKAIADRKAAIADTKAAKEQAEQKARIAKERERIAKYQVCISAGDEHTAGLKANGTVVAVGSNTDLNGNKTGQCNVSGWRGIVAVAAGYYHTVGLKADGTVVAVGDNDKGQCNVSDWRDIVAVAADYYHTAGLKTDGTVVAVGSNDKGQCNVSDWRDIVAVSAGYNRTFGLKADGTVVAVGDNADGRCNVSDWRDMVAVSARGIFGLKADGTVVSPYDNRLSGWRDIVAVAEGGNHTVGLKADGTVVAVGDNEKGQCNVSDWRDIGPVSKWKAQGLCAYCGGQLGGVLTKKCKECGKEKNY